MVKKTKCSRLFGEYAVTLSVAASFLAAIPMFFMQLGKFGEVSFAQFAIFVLIAVSITFPFACSAMNVGYLVVSDFRGQHIDAGARMETATLAVGTLGVICSTAFLFVVGPDFANSAELDWMLISGVVAILAIVAFFVNRPLDGSSENANRARIALAAQLVASIAFEIFLLPRASMPLTILLLLYPANIALILAKRFRNVGR